MWAGLEGAASRAGVGALALSHPFSLHLGGALGARCGQGARVREQAGWSCVLW